MKRLLDNWRKEIVVLKVAKRERILISISLLWLNDQIGRNDINRPRRKRLISNSLEFFFFLDHLRGQESRFWPQGIFITRISVPCSYRKRHNDNQYWNDVTCAVYFLSLIFILILNSSFHFFFFIRLEWSIFFFFYKLRNGDAVGNCVVIRFVNRLNYYVCVRNYQSTIVFRQRYSTCKVTCYHYFCSISFVLRN